MTREELLQKAAETVCGSREQAHGNPHGTFERIARAWSAYLDVELTAADGAVMTAGALKRGGVIWRKGMVAHIREARMQSPKT